ncbi:MAG: hypothetical protein K0Q77_867 [Anaerosporomusa subterranea]|nr:hypothetical protein [Anaerosporomusa subterranea]
MNHCPVIMAILQAKRTETAVKVQDVLTKYGCYIRVRLGLHDAALDSCSSHGLILLQLCGDEIPTQELQKELEAIPEVKVKHMTMEF